MRETLSPSSVRGVRFDVFLELENAYATVELQMRNSDDILRRVRYYQCALTTTSCLQKGAKFSELKNSYVIFFCACDAFDDGEPVHIIQNVVHSGKFGDGKCTFCTDGAKSVVVCNPVAARVFDGPLSEFFELMCGYSVDSLALSTFEEKVRSVVMSSEYKFDWRSWITEEEISDAEARGEALGEIRGARKALGLLYKRDVLPKEQYEAAVAALPSEE